MRHNLSRWWLIYIYIMLTLICMRSSVTHKKGNATDLLCQSYYRIRDQVPTLDIPTEWKTRVSVKKITSWYKCQTLVNIGSGNGLLLSGNKPLHWALLLSLCKYFLNISVRICALCCWECLSDAMQLLLCKFSSSDFQGKPPSNQKPC